MRNLNLLVLGCLVCVSCSSPTGPTEFFAVLSTSPPAGGTVALPADWPKYPRVLAPTVTIQFKYFQPLPNATVIIDLMKGSNVCLQAEGLTMGPGYAFSRPYAVGSTVTVTGNNFEHNVSYPVCGTSTFTTDHLRFQLLSFSTPVETQDVAIGWTFSK